MGVRWKKVTLEGNDGDVAAWGRDGYLVYLNRNHGQTPPLPSRGQRDRHGDYWWFEVWTVDAYGSEVTCVGEAPSLAIAKAMADQHRNKVG